MYIIRYLGRFVNSYKKIGVFSYFTSQKDASCKLAGCPSPVLQVAQDFLQNWALARGTSGGETQGPQAEDAERAECPPGKCSRDGGIMLAGGDRGRGVQKEILPGRARRGVRDAPIRGPGILQTICLLPVGAAPLPIPGGFRETARPANGKAC